MAVTVTVAVAVVLLSRSLCRSAFNTFKSVQYTPPLECLPSLSENMIDVDGGLFFVAVFRRRCVCHSDLFDCALRQ